MKLNIPTANKQNPQETQEIKNSLHKSIVHNKKIKNSPKVNQFAYYFETRGRKIIPAFEETALENEKQVEKVEEASTDAVLKSQTSKRNYYPSCKFVIPFRESPRTVYS